MRTDRIDDSRNGSNNLPRIEDPKDPKVFEISKIETECRGAVAGLDSSENAPIPSLSNLPGTALLIMLDRPQITHLSTWRNMYVYIVVRHSSACTDLPGTNEAVAIHQPAEPTRFHPFNYCSAHLNLLLYLYISLSVSSISAVLFFVRPILPGTARASPHRLYIRR